MNLPPWAKILPNQSVNSDLFRGRQPVEKSIYEAILQVSSIQEPASRFKLETSPLFTIEEMASSPICLGLMQWLIKLSKAKRVLEIGTFIGVSALYFAKALPADGRVITIEKFYRFAAIARNNFLANGYQYKIELKLGDAGDILPTLPSYELFDMAFIDGNKESYADYFCMVSPLITPGGIIVIDDMFFHGDALNETPKTDKGKGVRSMLIMAETFSDWQRILLPISNGILLMIKPDRV